MKTLTPEQRIEGFTELEGVLGEGGVGGAHLMSFLAGVAHAEKVLAEPEQDEEPVAWMLISTVGSRHYHMSEQQALKGLQMYGGKVIALYDHPAPRKSFVRLSEEEVNSLTYAPLEPYELICAVENRLAEKNSER